MSMTPKPVLNVPLVCPGCGMVTITLPVNQVLYDAKYPVHQHLPHWWGCGNNNKEYYLDEDLKVHEITDASRKTYKEGQHSEEAPSVATRS